MIEHIIITLIVCFTVLVAIGQITNALQVKWKQQNDEQPTVKILRRTEEQ